MGAPHPIYGESVEACVTMTDGGASFDQEALKSALRRVIARFKVPSHIFLYDRFPLNVNGKLDQRALHADMLTRIKRLTVDEELAGGVTVFDVVVRNSNYAIVPVTSMASELAEAVGFSRRRVMYIYCRRICRRSITRLPMTRGRKSGSTLPANLLIRSFSVTVCLG
jgi:fatty-acyl-CoA synthase